MMTMGFTGWFSLVRMTALLAHERVAGTLAFVWIHDRDEASCSRIGRLCCTCKYQAGAGEK